MSKKDKVASLLDTHNLSELKCMKLQKLMYQKCYLSMPIKSGINTEVLQIFAFLTLNDIGFTTEFIMNDFCIYPDCKISEVKDVIDKKFYYEEFEDIEEE